MANHPNSQRKVDSYLYRYKRELNRRRLRRAMAIFLLLGVGLSIYYISNFKLKKGGDPELAENTSISSEYSTPDQENAELSPVALQEDSGSLDTSQRVYQGDDEPVLDTKTSASIRPTSGTTPKPSAPATNNSSDLPPPVVRGPSLEENTDSSNSNSPQKETPFPQAATPSEAAETTEKIPETSPISPSGSIDNPEISGIAVAPSTPDQIEKVTSEEEKQQELPVKDLSTPGEAVKAPREVADRMPSFPGGTMAMRNFLNSQIAYPQAARDAKIEGKVYVQFVVAEDGELQDFNVLRGLGYGCDREAIRIAKAMPRWIPGEHMGEKVPVYYTLPVQFKFQ